MTMHRRTGELIAMGIVAGSAAVVVVVAVRLGTVVLDVGTTTVTSGEMRAPAATSPASPVSEPAMPASPVSEPAMPTSPGAALDAGAALPEPPLPPGGVSPDLGTSPKDAEPLAASVESAAAPPEARADEERIIIEIRPRDPGVTDNASVPSAPARSLKVREAARERVEATAPSTVASVRAPAPELGGAGAFLTTPPTWAASAWQSNPNAGAGAFLTTPPIWGASAWQSNPNAGAGRFTTETPPQYPFVGPTPIVVIPQVVLTPR
jgi:hypothetical protein